MFDFHDRGFKVSNSNEKYFEEIKICGLFCVCQKNENGKELCRHERLE